MSESNSWQEPPHACCARLDRTATCQVYHFSEHDRGWEREVGREGGGGEGETERLDGEREGGRVGGWVGGWGGETREWVMASEYLERLKP